MIENFGVITRSGEKLKSDLGVGVNMYNNTKDKASLDIFNTKNNGIYWNFKGTEVTVFSDHGGVTGYPCVDLSCVMVIYPATKNSEFPAPDNAVIYDGLGNLKNTLQIPELISGLGKEKVKSAKAGGEINCWFEMVGWNRNSAGDTVLTSWIGFANDFFEERVVYPETGEFGDCLGSGRL